MKVKIPIWRMRRDFLSEICKSTNHYKMYSVDKINIERNLESFGKQKTVYSGLIYRWGDQNSETSHYPRSYNYHEIFYVSCKAMVSYQWDYITTLLLLLDSGAGLVYIALNGNKEMKELVFMTIFL